MPRCHYYLWKLVYVQNPIILTDILTAFFINNLLHIGKHMAFTRFLLYTRPVPNITKDIFFLLLRSWQELEIRHPQINVINVSSMYRNQCALGKASKGFQTGEGIPLLSSCLV